MPSQDAGKDELDIRHIRTQQIAFEQGQVSLVDGWHAPGLADTDGPVLGVDHDQRGLPRRRQRLGHAVCPAFGQRRRQLDQADIADSGQSDLPESNLSNAKVRMTLDSFLSLVQSLPRCRQASSNAGTPPLLDVNTLLRSGFHRLASGDSLA